MSLLEALDATRICSSAALADPAAWARPVSTVKRVPASEPSGCFSWLSLIRNPRAMLVTGMVGGVIATDVALRMFGPARVFLGADPRISSPPRPTRAADNSRTDPKPSRC